jgi:hypothetical protein
MRDLKKRFKITNSDIFFKQGFRSASMSGGNRLCIITIKFILDISESNPITGLDSPEGSRRLRLPDFKTIGT